MTSTEAAPAEKTSAQATEYIVLRLVKHEGEPASDPRDSYQTHSFAGLDHYARIGTWAGTQQQALKLAAQSLAIGDNEEYSPGTYVAVPARSFQPRTLKTETRTKVSIG